MKTLRHYTLLTSAIALLASINSAASETTIAVTAENFSHAETARNYRNWAAQGANNHVCHDARAASSRKSGGNGANERRHQLYGSAIVEAVDGKVTFSIPDTDNYLAVQVVTERGHGQQYVVEDGVYNLPVESQYAFLIYRSGTEHGIDVAKANLGKVDVTDFNFATSYQVQPYDYDEVEKWVKRYTQEVNSMDNFTYTFPRTSKDVTDLHQWNLENAAGWGGASPEAFVGNKYANSSKMKAGTCYTSTFDDPENQFFTSITAYDNDKYLMEDVRSISSHTWDKNSDGTITVSFNCGENAPNNIDDARQMVTSPRLTADHVITA